ncbi:hypothetical protein IW248_000757 [Micromonospora ureilytica]|uniref:Uncharacterized protein n=1 Tax=Micromonospora ureilytica TaxID=709868 RepID=A0ABS0JCK0_9ACTN|nr:hypothetical protein [Micromonospora ureilytica]
MSPLDSSRGVARHEVSSHRFECLLSANALEDGIRSQTIRQVTDGLHYRGPGVDKGCLR